MEEERNFINSNIDRLSEELSCLEDKGSVHDLEDIPHELSVWIKIKQRFDGYVDDLSRMYSRGVRDYEKECDENMLLFIEYVAKNHYKLVNIVGKECIWASESELGIKTTKELFEDYNNNA